MGKKNRFKDNFSRISFLIWNSKIHKKGIDSAEARFKLEEIKAITSPSMGILELELEGKGKNLFYLKELHDSERDILIAFCKPKEVKKASLRTDKPHKNTRWLTINAEKGQRIMLEIKIGA